MFANGLSLLSQVEQLRREVDRALESAGLAVPGFLTREPRAYPPLNVWDAGEALCVEAEIPGVKKDDIEVLAVGNELTIKGRRETPNGGKLCYHRRECGTGEFTRTVTLPVEVNAEKIEAVLDHGVLTLRLPKAETAMPKRIQVKVG